MVVPASARLNFRESVLVGARVVVAALVTYLRHARTSVATAVWEAARSGLTTSASRTRSAYRIGARRRASIAHRGLNIRFLGVRPRNRITSMSTLSSTRLLVAVSVGCFAGCASFQPVAGDIVRDPSTGGCRDTSTGRELATCPSDGPSAEAVLAGIGIVAGLTHRGCDLHSHSPQLAPSSAAPPQRGGTRAGDEGAQRGRRGTFRRVGSPHRCIDSAGTTGMVAGAETCASRGLAEPTTAEPTIATPQRGPASTHRILRCYDAILSKI